jgi:hypothetical protein
VIPVGYDPAAELELLGQIAFLESRRAGLGSRFFSEVKASEDFISRFPAGSVEIEPGLRKRVLTDFQDSLYYFLDEQGATVLAGRKPGYWKPRVPAK